MSGKRQATSNLNHENWDQEEEPEERGTFRKASEDELKNRVIKKARRKVAGNSGAGGGADATDDGAPKSVFSGFAGFGKPATSTAPAASPFSFLSKISTPSDSNANAKSNTTFSFGGAAKAPEDGNEAKNKPTFSFGSTAKASVESNTAISTAGFSFGATAKAPVDSNNPKTSANFSFGASTKAPVLSENKDTETSSKTESGKGKSASYQSKIKSLNQAVTEWIKTHVDKNPLCILSPIFKDYEKYLTEIDEEEKMLEKSSNNNTPTNDNKLPTSTADKFKFSASPSKTVNSSPSGSTATFSFGLNTNSSPTVSTTSTSNFLTSGSKPSAEPVKTNTFSFGMKPTDNNDSGKDAKEPQGFSFGAKSDNKASTNVATGFTFGKPSTNNGEAADKPAPFSFTPGSTPFSFGNIKPPAAPSTSDGANGAEDEEDQPPKVEFKQVVEEDAVYSKKCKVFVKKDGAFAERGVGTLYLKPVKESEKTQLLVRADTNLGNILVNLILSAGIPAQRMGKNNVMMVCLPTPDVEKPTSMLLRVKTAEEADELLAELEKHKK